VLSTDTLGALLRVPRYCSRLPVPAAKGVRNFPRRNVIKSGTNWKPLRVRGLVGYVDPDCAEAGEALRAPPQGQLRPRQQICCPTALPGLAVHLRAAFRRERLRLRAWLWEAADRLPRHTPPIRAGERRSECAHRARAAGWLDFWWTTRPTRRSPPCCSLAWPATSRYRSGEDPSGRLEPNVAHRSSLDCSA
jgi:hypothetical protein